MIMRFTWLLGCLVILGVAAQAQLATAETPPLRTIMVSGTAERQVPPDLGTVVFAIQTQSDTVARAVTQNNDITTRVMQAVRQLNIRNLTMRTLGFDVQPVYEQPGNQPVTRPLRVVGYIVVNRIEVRIPEADPTRLSDTIGRVLDVGLTAGANRVDSVNFSLENDQPVMREAMAEAIRNARDMAGAMATAAGVTLGPLQTLSASPIYAQPPTPYMARAVEGVQGVPIVAGPLTVQVTVNAVYRIQ